MRVSPHLTLFFMPRKSWIENIFVTSKKQCYAKYIYDWMQKVEQDDVDEMLNFQSLIERNLLPVLNYFRFGATNAIAENINSQIQRFIMINQGVRDREFFYFRMRKYFSTPPAGTPK